VLNGEQTIVALLTDCGYIDVLIGVLQQDAEIQVCYVLSRFNGVTIEGVLIGNLIY
jgi:hypothetical protein